MTFSFYGRIAWHSTCSSCDQMGSGRGCDVGGEDRKNANDEERSGMRRGRSGIVRLDALICKFEGVWRLDLCALTQKL